MLKNLFISKLSKVNGMNLKNDYLFQVENTKFRFIKIKLPKGYGSFNWKVVTYVDFDYPDFQYLGHAKTLKQCKQMAIHKGGE